MITRTFMDKNCDGGVSVAMDEKLTAAEGVLRALYQQEISSGAFVGTLSEWARLRESHRAAHPGGYHTTGDAVDVNYNTNPYIVIRTPTATGGVIYGGEDPAPPGMQMARVGVTTAYDRARAFLSTSWTVANVSARADGESTSSVFQRFQAASYDLQAYLQLAILQTMPSTLGSPAQLNRAPIPNAASASLDELLAGIPESERLPDSVVRDTIDLFVSDPNFAANHPGWDTTVDFWYRQILRDYEVVRVPTEFGAPSLAPPLTRNPANGFLDLREDVVTALAGDSPLGFVGALMRWGVCDFGAGSSGDVMHFDLAQRISSGVAGTIPPEVRIDLFTGAGIQQALAALGFDPGTIDNNPGPGTQLAVDGFRQQRGLPPGGIDDDLRAELGVALVAAAIPF